MTVLPPSSVMENMFLEKEQTYMAQVRQAYPELLREFPLEIYWTELSKKDPNMHYETFSTKLEKLLFEIKEKLGIRALAHYHRLGMCRLVIDTLNKLGDRQLPGEIHSLYYKWFKRIYNDFSEQPDFYYDHEKLLWPLRKDLAICSGRAIPAGGAWLVETRRLRPRHLTAKAPAFDPDAGIVCGDIPAPGLLRSLVAHMLNGTGTVGRLLNKIISMVRETGAQYEWFYVIHTVDRDIKDFNREKMNLAYRNIIELMKLDPRIQGIFRESWFLDPNLKEISPGLSFLWEDPVKNGARLYYAGPCDRKQVDSATRLSPERSRLYREGLYKPGSYFYFWSRDNVINGIYD